MVDPVLNVITGLLVKFPPEVGQVVEVVEKPVKVNGDVLVAGGVTVAVTDTLAPVESLPAFPTDVKHMVLPVAVPFQALPVLAVILVAFATVKPEGMVILTPPMFLPLMFAVNLTLWASPAQKLVLSRVKLNCAKALLVRKRFAITSTIVNAKALGKETFIKRLVLSVYEQDVTGEETSSV